MPEWIHNRAEHLLAKNPDMSKSKAFAIATQQSHSLGKSPKGYGTAEGRRTAKAKFDTPKDDVKSANPGKLNSPKLAAMRIELLKLADLIPGGKADGKTDKDFDKEQLAKGEKVEQEHAKGNRTLAREIARDHLEEIPDYYSRLKRMEDSAPKRKEAAMALELLKIAQFATSQFSGPTGEGIRRARQSSQVPPMSKQEILVKQAFQTSQFSGPLSMGGFKQESQQPGMSAPQAAVKAAPSTAGRGGLPNAGSAAPQVKAAAQGYGSTIANVTSPASSLSRTQAVGQGKIEAGPGPSIADQVKPRNFGAGSPVGPTMPGAGKSIGGV